MSSLQGRSYVGDLRGWGLPRLEDLEDELTEEFAARARLVFLEHEGSAGQFHALFLQRLREMAGAAVNEILEYWLKGLGNGCDGHFPELCVELPYLERAEKKDPLALAYCVDNEDGSRTELIRVTLGCVFERILDSGISDSARLKVVAGELRALARSLEERVNPTNT